MFCILTDCLNKATFFENAKHPKCIYETRKTKQQRHEKRAQNRAKTYKEALQQRRV